MRQELEKFINWLYEGDYMIIRASERPYPGDMSHDDLMEIVGSYLKVREE